jgi:hypothetical protein
VPKQIHGTPEQSARSDLLVFPTYSLSNRQECGSTPTPEAPRGLKTKNDLRNFFRIQTIQPKDKAGGLVDHKDSANY